MNMNEKLERYIMTDSNGNDEINAELARLGPQYVDEIITLLLKLIRNLPEGIPPMPGVRGGMSPLHRVLAFTATDKAWRIISKMGWAGIQVLLSAIDSDNHTRGVVACIILCEEEAPNQKIAEEIKVDISFTLTPASN